MNSRIKKLPEYVQVLSIPNKCMARDRLGGVPYDSTKEGKKIKVRFYPKTDNAKNPDSIVFTMLLDESDKEKLLKLFK